MLSESESSDNKGEKFSFSVKDNTGWISKSRALSKENWQTLLDSSMLFKSLLTREAVLDLKVHNSDFKVRELLANAGVKNPNFLVMQTLYYNFGFIENGDRLLPFIDTQLNSGTSREAAMKDSAGSKPKIVEALYMNAASCSLATFAPNVS